MGILQSSGVYYINVRKYEDIYIAVLFLVSCKINNKPRCFYYESKGNNLCLEVQSYNDHEAIILNKLDTIFTRTVAANSFNIDLYIDKSSNIIYYPPNMDVCHITSKHFIFKEMKIDKKYDIIETLYYPDSATLNSCARITSFEIPDVDIESDKKSESFHLIKVIDYNGEELPIDFMKNRKFS